MNMDNDFEPQQPFWLVWCDNGGVPTVKHATEYSARKEAERLASANPGQRFHVLSAIGHCQFNAVNWIPVDPTCVPF